MILSNHDLRERIASGELIIDPPPPFENFATSSLDLRVGRDFWKWRKEVDGVQLIIDCSIAQVPQLRQYAEAVKPDAQGYVDIPCNGFLLGMTLERIQLPPSSKLAARVEGRSSLARLGLGVHITAPIIHAGFDGPVVLEFMNHGPHVLKLKAGETCVCQIVVETLTSEPTGELDTVFQNQTGAFGKQD